MKLIQKPNLDFVPPGPVAGRYMRSRARVQGIMGPMGSGKTIASLMKLVIYAGQQVPNANGVRETRWVVVRDTYRQLWRTVIPSWWKRFPKDTPGTHWDGGKDQPATHELRFALNDGTMVRTFFDFVAIGENTAEDVLKGYEPTGFYLNEADLLAKDVIEYADTRHGRFPEIYQGGPTWSGILCDFNGPADDNWTHEVFDEKREEWGAEFFEQPSGLSPQAENLANLPGGRRYYVNMSRGKAPWFIRRNVHGTWGPNRDGKPVHEGFNQSIHVAEAELELDPALGCRMGGDAGLTPAVVLVQYMPNGQIRILDELVHDRAGAVNFAPRINLWLADGWAEADIDRAWGDPAGDSGSAATSVEDTWLSSMSQLTGIPWLPAPTNNLSKRLQAVDACLATILSDGQPKLLISPKCKTLIRALNSMYRYKRIRIGENLFDNIPEKNKWSHVADALQYLLVGGGEHRLVGERWGRSGGNRPRQTHTMTEDHPGSFDQGEGERYGRSGPGAGGFRQDHADG